MNDFSKEFKIIAISENSNSFGLKQFLAVARDGSAFKACANYLNLPTKGSIISMPMTIDGVLLPSKMSYELCELVEPAPYKVVTELFPELKN